MSRYHNPPPPDAPHQSEGQPRQTTQPHAPNQRMEPPTFAVEDDYPQQGYGRQASPAADPYAALRPDETYGGGYAMPNAGQPHPTAAPPAHQPANPTNANAHWPNQPSPYGQHQHGHAQPAPFPADPHQPADQTQTAGRGDFRQDYREYAAQQSPANAQAGRTAPPQGGEPHLTELSAALTSYATPQNQTAAGPRPHPAARQRVPSSFPQPEFSNYEQQPSQPDPSAFGIGGLNAHQTPAMGHADPFGAAHAPGTGPMTGQDWPQAEPTFGPDGAFNDGLAHGADEFGHHPEFADADQYDDFEDDPPRRTGLGRIAAVVAIFVALGGGLTYAFQTFMASDPKKTASAPVVKKDSSRPIKVKPANPGGKQFAHADSKVMGRLGDRSASSFDGVRRVATVPVGPDGTVRVPPAPSSSSGSTGVPGLTVVGGGFGSPQAPDSKAPANPSRVPKIITASGQKDPVVVTPPAAKKTTAKPKKVAVVGPAAGAPNRPSSAATAKPKAKPAAPKPPKKAPVKTAAAQPKVSVSANGYVAVLASVPASSTSRLRALQQYADIQQKYTDLLRNKRPDVREANLGAKGTYHRLLVGPPGSRSAASQLCKDLKASGYPSCWVTAY